MGFPVRALGLGAAWAVVLASCSVPTDKAKDIQVVVEAPHDFLLRGEDMSVRARAFRLAGTDTVDVPNVDFVWTSGSSNTARVDEDCCGYATVTGVNRGPVDITASATGFENSTEGRLTLRVADALEIDSVRPATVRFGQKATIFGLGMDKVIATSIGGDPWFPDTFAIGGERGGPGSIESWVLPPSSSGQVSVAGGGFIKQDAATTSVIPVDIFEPDSAAPAVIDINGSGGPRTSREGFPVLFFNPGLYYEAVPQGSFSAVDWFRFARSDTTGPVTFIINSSVQFDTAFSYLSDSLFFSNGSYYVGDSAWIISPGFYACNNQYFFPDERRPQSTIIALNSLPGPRRGLQLLSFYQVEGQYSLVALRGYVTANPKIRPDRFEENDLWCNYAEANFTDATRRIVLDNTTPLFQDSTLTIDNPHDADWYKFRVGGLAADTVTIASKPLPLGPADFSNIDLYVRRASDFAFVGYAETPGSYETLKLYLAPGDYYLGVVDSIGVPTRYSLCMRKSSGFGCNPPGTAPAPVIRPAAGAPQPWRDQSVPPPGRIPPLLRLPSARP